MHSADAQMCFTSSVAAGRQRTEPIQELPTLEEVDCASVKRGAEVYEEETPLDEDTLAEIDTPTDWAIIEGLVAAKFGTVPRTWGF